MSACQIDGKQCTACCRTITIPHSRRKLVAKFGDQAVGDAGFVLDNWKPIKRRIAKKKNAYVVGLFGKPTVSYWHCTKVTDTGCSVYDRRPRVCREYPLYGHTYERVAKVYAEKGIKPEYHPDCTEWPRIPVTDITQPAGPSLAQEIQ